LHEVNSISEGTVDKVCQIHPRQVRWIQSLRNRIRACMIRWMVDVHNF
jgi:hypothetical protein